jgi:hypothetical protein
VRVLAINKWVATVVVLARLETMLRARAWDLDARVAHFFDATAGAACWP